MKSQIPEYNFWNPSQKKPMTWASKSKRTVKPKKPEIQEDIGLAMAIRRKKK